VNGVLRKINEIMRKEISRGWRKMRNEELCDLCSLPNIILVITLWSMSGAFSTHSGENKAYKILVQNMKKKRRRGRYRHGWEDNIKLDIKDIKVKVKVSL
jgi:hypothetical protein